MPRHRQAVELLPAISQAGGIMRAVLSHVAEVNDGIGSVRRHVMKDRIPVGLRFLAGGGEVSV
jgi:hypothetical protein